MATLLKLVPGTLTFERRTPDPSRHHLDVEIERHAAEGRKKRADADAWKAALDDLGNARRESVRTSLARERRITPYAQAVTDADVTRVIRKRYEAAVSGAEWSENEATRWRQKEPAEDPKLFDVTFSSSSTKLEAEVSLERGEALQASAPHEPFLLCDVKEKRYWVVDGRVYVTTDGALTADEVSALAHEASNRRRLQLEKAMSLQAMTRELDTKAKREPIPQDVKVTVWQRDGGRCVECGSKENLEFDHIIPLAMGGANTMRNLQLLCETCNRRKGATLG